MGNEITVTVKHLFSQSDIAGAIRQVGNGIVYK